MPKEEKRKVGKEDERKGLDEQFIALKKWVKQEMIRNMETDGVKQECKVLHKWGVSWLL